MICRLRTLRSGDVHISRTHMWQIPEHCQELKDLNINLKLAAGFQDAEERLTKLDNIAVQLINSGKAAATMSRETAMLSLKSMKLSCGEFPWISTEVCKREVLAYTLWAQPKFFTLSGITSYNPMLHSQLCICALFSDFMQYNLQ